MAAQTCRGVWAALEGARTVSLDDLELLIAGDPRSILAYLNLLIRHDYVALSGPRKSVSGDSLILFRLTKRTGPGAPYENEEGHFVDPNARNQIKLGSRWSLPSWSARIRHAAECLNRPFTREEISDVVSRNREDRHHFQTAWNQLRASGQIVRTENPRHFVVRIVADVLAIREYLRERPGQWIGSMEIADDLGAFAVTFQRIKQALDLAAAEGYEVRIAERQETGGTRRFTYRIEGL